ncbi:unnamed protein product [Amoebophrya sp. A25]|nr:unnamed protein product [Amoebophrya sp. A25]|eukprot:GSA25T00026112001.1
MTEEVQEYCGPIIFGETKTTAITVSPVSRSTALDMVLRDYSNSKGNVRIVRRAKHDKRSTPVGGANMAASIPDFPVAADATPEEEVLLFLTAPFLYMNDENEPATPTRMSVRKSAVPLAFSSFDSMTTSSDDDFEDVLSPQSSTSDNGGKSNMMPRTRSPRNHMMGAKAGASPSSSTTTTSAPGNKDMKGRALPPKFDKFFRQELEEDNVPEESFMTPANAFKAGMALAQSSTTTITKEPDDVTKDEDGRAAGVKNDSLVEEQTRRAAEVTAKLVSDPESPAEGIHKGPLPESPRTTGNGTPRVSFSDAEDVTFIENNAKNGYSTEKKATHSSKNANGAPAAPVAAASRPEASSTPQAEEDEEDAVVNMIADQLVEEFASSANGDVHLSPTQRLSDSELAFQANARGKWTMADLHTKDSKTSSKTSSAKASMKPEGGAQQAEEAPVVIISTKDFMDHMEDEVGMTHRTDTSFRTAIDSGSSSPLYSDDDNEAFQTPKNMMSPRTNSGKSSPARTHRSRAASPSDKAAAILDRAGMMPGKREPGSKPAPKSVLERPPPTTWRNQTAGTDPTPFSHSRSAANNTSTPRTSNIRDGSPKATPRGSGTGKAALDATTPRPMCVSKNAPDVNPPASPTEARAQEQKALPPPSGLSMPGTLPLMRSGGPPVPVPQLKMQASKFFPLMGTPRAPLLQSTGGPTLPGYEQQGTTESARGPNEEDVLEEVSQYHSDDSDVVGDEYTARGRGRTLDQSRQTSAPTRTPSPNVLTKRRNLFVPPPPKERKIDPLPKEYQLQLQAVTDKLDSLKLSKDQAKQRQLEIANMRRLEQERLIQAQGARKGLFFPPDMPKVPGPNRPELAEPDLQAALDVLRGKQTASAQLQMLSSARTTPRQMVQATGDYDPEYVSPEHVALESTARATPRALVTGKHPIHMWGEYRPSPVLPSSRGVNRDITNVDEPDMNAVPTTTSQVSSPTMSEASALTIMPSTPSLTPAAAGGTHLIPMPASPRLPAPPALMPIPPPNVTNSGPQLPQRAQMTPRDLHQEIRQAVQGIQRPIIGTTPINSPRMRTHGRVFTYMSEEQAAMAAAERRRLGTDLLPLPEQALSLFSSSVVGGNDGTDQAGDGEGEREQDVEHQQAPKEREQVEEDSRRSRRKAKGDASGRIVLMVGGKKHYGPPEKKPEPESEEQSVAAKQHPLARWSKTLQMPVSTLNVPAINVIALPLKQVQIQSTALMLPKREPPPPKINVKPPPGLPFPDLMSKGMRKLGDEMPAAQRRREATMNKGKNLFAREQPVAEESPLMAASRRRRGRDKRKTGVHALDAERGLLD